jgi:photosystem II stability/assembly factor-like uncharacterized protein
MRLARLLLLLPLTSVAYTQVNPHTFDAMRWRCIGPFRGGRTVGAVGIPGQPNVFYIGVNNGGVWKTTDYGRTWNPIFDDQPTGSIGAIALAPSDPKTIYVGSGEGLQRPDLSTGDGVYRSRDAGKSWEHLGLRDAQQISSIVVDPHNPDRVFVAALGHPYGPNEERGVFRSTDGGKSFQKVLYKDVDTGAVALAFDPMNESVIYADLWAARQGPWENGQWQGPNSGLYKSTDGGTTWRQLSGGLPTFAQGLGRIGFSISPTDPKRIFATVDADNGGVYRSDDAGETWTLLTKEARLWGRGSDFAEIKVDPKNRDVVYIANTSTYKSTDGGKNFDAWKGAPGGDDYHTVWVNPDDTKIILLASDQGATVTVNGGETWSSWYNQPTAQMYHVSTDNQFPYWVYSGQQESGSAGVASRSNDGQITFREWHPVGAEEYGYVAPDPLNPNIIYGGKLQRYDKVTGQVQNVSPDPVRRGRNFRFLRTAPVVFSPVDPHVLFFAGNVIFRTRNGGHDWETISPDLTREHPDVPESIGVYKPQVPKDMRRRGVIYAVAPSYVDVNTIWAGTDDGLIHVTHDGGKTWSDVTPPGITAWSKVSIIDAGRFDANTAYAAINRIRLDDMRPHIYRTHDGGKSWAEIVNGLQDNAPINAVREDPVRKGLLFSGSERAVFFSIDDGDHWQPLRLNMPATSIRDVVVHEDDLVVGTHGRSFWILDDITPLRQVTSDTSNIAAVLYRPQVATRIHWNNNSDTPLPPEEPAGKNPPDGAILNYYLKEASSSPVILEILDGAGQLVRRYSSADKIEDVDPKTLEIPTYWLRPAQVLPNQPGAHRFLWDLRWQEYGHSGFYPIAAIFHDTAQYPTSPWVMPGQYTARLTVNGKVYTQPLTVRMDPRVTTPVSDLQHQFDLAFRAYRAGGDVGTASAEITSLRSQIKTARPQATGGLATDLDVYDKKLATLVDGPNGFSQLQQGLGSVMAEIEAADLAPTVPLEQAITGLLSRVPAAMASWDQAKQDVPRLNSRLKSAKLPQLKL